MTGRDSDEFAVALAFLAETFGEALSDLRIEGYFQALSAYELAELRAALRVWPQRSKYFPKPFELIEVLDDTRVGHRRAVREASEAAERRALSPSTEAEHIAAEHARGDFGALVQKLTAEMRGRFARPGEPPPPVTLEDAAAHREQAKAAARLYRIAYGIPDPPERP